MTEADRLLREVAAIKRYDPHSGRRATSRITLNATPSLLLQIDTYLASPHAECICPKCGIRHGGGDANAEF